METNTLEVQFDERGCPPWEFPDPEGSLKGFFQELEDLRKENQELRATLEEARAIDPVILKEQAERLKEREKEIERLIELKVSVRTATLNDRVLKLTYELQQARRLHRP